MWQVDATCSRPGHSAPIWAVAFSPDSERIVTGGEDRTARVWEAATGHGLLTMPGHLAAIVSVAFSHDGHQIATGSWDHTVKVWDVASGRDWHAQGPCDRSDHGLFS
jgi:WD40 repeat protein